MDRKKRCEIVRAMDLIAWTLNNDPLFTEWMLNYQYFAFYSESVILVLTIISN